jgi:hypothetical protein
MDTNSNNTYTILLDNAVVTKLPITASPFRIASAAQWTRTGSKPEWIPVFWTACTDNTARKYDAKTGEELGVIHAPCEIVDIHAAGQNVYLEVPTGNVQEFFEKDTIMGLRFKLQRREDGRFTGLEHVPRGQRVNVDECPTTLVAFENSIPDGLVTCVKHSHALIAAPRGSTGAEQKSDFMFPYWTPGSAIQSGPAGLWSAYLSDGNLMVASLDSNLNRDVNQRNYEAALEDAVNGRYTIVPDHRSPHKIAGKRMQFVKKEEGYVLEEQNVPLLMKDDEPSRSYKSFADADFKHDHVLLLVRPNQKKEYDFGWQNNSAGAVIRLDARALKLEGLDSSDRRQSLETVLRV